MSTKELTIRKQTDITKNGDLDLVHTLNKLSALLEDAIEIAKDNRIKAIELYETESVYLDKVREHMLVSEDSALEKNVINAMKLVQESTKSLEGPIMALTRILATKIATNAGMNGPINSPVNIHDLKNQM